MNATSKRLPIPAALRMPEVSKSDADKLAVFAHYLQMRTLIDDDALRRGFYLNVSRSKLRSMLGSCYRRTVELAQSIGFVEVNDSYSTGMPGTKAFSKSYRLNERYRDGRANYYKLQTKPMVNKAKRILEIDVSELKLAGVHLVSKFENFRLRATVVEVASKLGFWKQYFISRLLESAHFATRCGYGRFHSVITQAPKEAMPYLLADNKPVVTLDYSAMQPMIIGILAGKHTQQPNTTAAGPKHSTVICGSFFDIKLWLKLCESGEFYRHFEERIRASRQPVNVWYPRQRQPTDLRFKSYASIKRACLVPMMSPLVDMQRHPVFQMMAAEFPTVAEYLETTKQANYRNTARILQKFESELVIDGICGDIMRDHPALPIATKHDALIVPEYFASEAKRRMTDAFKPYGVSPSVKVES